MDTVDEREIFFLYWQTTQFFGHPAGTEVKIKLKSNCLAYKTQYLLRAKETAVCPLQETQEVCIYVFERSIFQTAGSDST
jgi:hypothetical protein